MPDWFKPYAKRLDESEKIARSKQSEADRASAALNKQVKRDFGAEVDRAVASATEELGLTPQQAQQYKRRLINDEMQRRVFEPQEEPQNSALPGSEAQKGPGFGELEILTAFGVTTSTPGVLDAMKSANGDPVALISGLRAIGESRAQLPTPSTATNAAPISGGTPPQKSQSELLTEYSQKMRAARGNPATLQSIKEEYRNAGLPVDQVVLN